jgi:hypothetical protein
LSVFFVSNISAICHLKNLCCDDIDQFIQCKEAQKKINDYCNLIINSNSSINLKNKIPDLECHSSIMCCRNKNHATTYCQNMDSYEKCNNSINLLEKFLSDVQNFIIIPNEFLENKPKIDCFHKESIANKYDWNNNGIYNFYDINSAYRFKTCYGFIVFIILIFYF